MCVRLQTDRSDNKEPVSLDEMLWANERNVSVKDQYSAGTTPPHMMPRQIPSASTRVTKLICYLNPPAPRLESH